LPTAIELTDIGLDPLPEPFFDQSLARLHAGSPQLPLRVRMPWRTMAALTELRQLPEPSGLVFHTGRCGSTLLANMLGAHPDTRVVKEPEALNQALLEGLPGADVRTLLRGYGAGLPPGGALVMKCTSWNAVRARQLLELVPGVPALFLWRSAAEVVASCLASGAAWDSWRASPVLVDRWFPQASGVAADPVAFYAHAWRATAAAALELSREPGRLVTLMGYHQLQQHPAVMAAEAARLFGLEVNEDANARMVAQTMRYSKDPAGRARFDPGERHARGRLDAADRHLVDQICHREEHELAEAAAPTQALLPGLAASGR
jgi:hypothetical protein